MPGYMTEVLVRRQQYEVMADTELREQRVDGPNLDALFPAVVAQTRSRHVVLAVRDDHRNRRKSIHDLLLGLRTVKPLEQLLKDEPGCNHALAGLQSTDQRVRRRVFGRLISTQD
jgi:hypothetical protein